MKYTTIALNKAINKIINKQLDKNKHCLCLDIQKTGLIIKKPKNYSRGSIWIIQDNWKEIFYNLLEQSHIESITQ